MMAAKFMDFVPSAFSFLLWGILFYAFVWVVYTRFFHPLRHVPGPFWASVSRYWMVATTAKGRMEHVQRALHEKYGPIIRIAPNEIACADPKMIKTIYPTQNALTKTAFYPVWHNKALSTYPDNFSVTDEKLHTQRRRIVNHVYTLSNVLQCEPCLDRCSELFIRQLGKIADNKQHLDLGQWLQWFTFDVIGELYFGSMFGFMKEAHDHEGWIASLDTLMPVLTTTALSPTYWRPFILGSSMFRSDVRRGLKAVDHITQAARDCVEARLAQPNHDSNSRDLLQQLLDIVKEKGEKLDFGMGEVELEAYVALLAGSDTTAIALRQIFYCLLKHPDIYEQLQRELDAAGEQGQFSAYVQYSEASRLPFLCACIKEAMRLHPSVGLTMPRLSPAPGVSLGNTYIPAGYSIGMNGAVIHYNRDVFGEDSDQFRPARWLDGDTSEMDKHLLTFGAGTRTCIGKNISLSEIHKLVPQVLRHFKLELAADAEWVTENIWFNKQSGLRVKICRR